MEKSLSSAADALKHIFNFDIVRRMFFLAGIAASVAVGAGLYQWVKEPVYRPLPYYVDEHNLQAIMQSLDKDHIPYQLNEHNHSVSVPLSELNMAKLSLARAGIKKEQGFSFSYLNDESKIGGSQFLENARYLHAMESDLAMTISNIQGINAAKVHLAIPQHNIFADERVKPSASVIVHVTPGYESDKEKVRAIIQLIAASIPELEPTRVMITNQYGHDLSAALHSNDFFSREHLDYQNNMQNFYEKKVRALITPIIGTNRASISVNLDLDFTQQEEAREEFDPEQKIVRSEQNVEENNQSGGVGGVPGALANLPPNQNDNQGGNQNGNQNKPQGGGQSRSESVKNYEISKSMRYTKSGSPKLKGISVAVVVDNEQVLDKAGKMVSKPLSKEKLAQLTSLVKSAIGFSKDRGDQVNVVNSSFIAEKIEVPPPAHFWEQPWFWELSKKILGIILGFAFLFMLYKKHFKQVSSDSKKMIPSGIEFSQDAHLTPEMLALKEEQLRILKELVAKEPNKVAGVIKKWISK